MKFLPLFCLATFLFLPMAGADVSIVEKIESNGATNNVYIKIKGERARIQANPKYSMIVDSRTGDVIALTHEQKAMQHLSAEKARALGDKFRQLAKDTDTSLEIATPKPTGKKQKINGYEAEEYVAETPKYKATYWVAQKYPDYETILGQMKLLQGSAFKSVRRQMPDYYDFPGLPIRTKIKLQGQQEATTTITSVSQDPIPDSEFEAPSDYAEMRLPDMEVHANPPAPAAASPSEASPTPEKPEGK